MMRDVSFSRRLACTLAAGALFAYLAWQAAWELHMAWRGTPTSAQVTRIERVSTRGVFSRPYRVEYRFTRDGRTFAGYVEARESFVNYLPGRTVAIRYDPRDPERHVVLPLDLFGHGLAFIVSLLATAFFAVWTLDARRASRRDRRHDHSADNADRA